MASPLINVCQIQKLVVEPVLKWSHFEDKVEFVPAGVLKRNETQPYLRNLQLSSEISRRLQPISSIKSVHATFGFPCSSDSATLI